MRAQCLPDVPESARAWDDGVWVNSTCLSFTVYCKELSGTSGTCELGRSNTFEYPLELAGACVNVKENGCAYLISPEESEYLENE